MLTGGRTDSDPPRADDHAAANAASPRGGDLPAHPNRHILEYVTRVFGSARIDEQKKKQAEELFASFGMSLCTAVNLFINEVIA